MKFFFINTFFRIKVLLLFQSQTQHYIANLLIPDTDSLDTMLKYVPLLFVLVNVASAATILDYNDGKATLPLSFKADSPDAVACLITTFPRPFPSHLSVFGHMSILLQHRNGTLETAGLTGKVGHPGGKCVQDNFLVNRKCELHKGLDVTFNKCGYVNDSSLVELSASFRETHDDSFQKQYSLFSWNCVVWAIQTWSLYGLPKVGFHILPFGVPILVW